MKVRDPFDISEWERLEPQVRTLWRVGNLVTTAVFAGLLAIPEFLVTRRLDWWFLPPLTVTVLVTLLSLGLGQYMVGKSFDRYRFRLGDDDLAVAKGVFWRNWRFVSRNRVQHVDITAGPVAQWLGLVEVSIYVGGMMTAAATIPGLTVRRGEELRARLIKDVTLDEGAAGSAFGGGGADLGEGSGGAVGSAAVVPPPLPVADRPDSEARPGEASGLGDGMGSPGGTMDGGREGRGG